MVLSQLYKIDEIMSPQGLFCSPYADTCDIMETEFLK